MSSQFISGGRLVAKAIRVEGVTHVFTLCGGHIQAIYDGCLDEGIRVVDTRHEQTAAHAADGWARVTGIPGVALVTAGPGVTNAVTAAATALRGQSPMVLIGGQGARAYGPLGGQDRGALQELNHVELMRPVTKWAVTVPETRRLAEYMQSAFRIATSGVPGPVFLEIPLDVLMGGCKSTEAIAYASYRTNAKPAGDPAFVERAAALISSAKKPLLILGSQWRWTAHPSALSTFLDAVPMPVFVNGMARGTFSTEHSLFFRHARSFALKEADCVLLVGTPLDFRLGYGEKIHREAKLIQVDLDGSEIGRNRKVEVGIVGDGGLVLDQLASSAKRLAYGSSSHEWLERVRAFELQQCEKIAAECESVVEPINPMRLCAEIKPFIDDKTIVIGDGGDFVASASYIVEPKGISSWLDPGPLGTLGIGPGYAMAAKLAKPDHRVVILFGDGAFGFHAAEFEALVRQGINIVGIIGNDACWTQIYRGQVTMYGEARAVATKLALTRYDHMVSAFGGHGEYVETLHELRPALERAFRAECPALVNVKIGTSPFRKNAFSV